MKIIELYAENFGKLSAYRCSFSDGINSFVEDNGFGKSTLAAFIMAMLYGIDDSRKSSLDENDRKKYAPWQGGAFGGWLTFETDGKQYRVERSFAVKASEDTFALFDLETESESHRFSQSLGEELFGIDRDGFLRTVFLSERNLSGKNTNQTISAKLSDLVGVEGDIGGFDNAIKLLDERRKFYQKKGGSGEIQDLRAQMHATEAELDILKAKRESSAEYERNIAEAAEGIGALRESKNSLLAQQKNIAAERERAAAEKMHADMIAAMDADLERKAEIEKFFGGKIPEEHEIKSASDALIEISRLEGALADMSTDTELSRLEAIFRPEDSEQRCRSMADLAETLEVQRAKLASEASDISAPPSPFKRTPTEEQIERAALAVSEKKEKKGSVGLPLILVSTLLALIGVTLGLFINPILYSVIILAVLPIIIFIFKRKSAKSDASNAFDLDGFINETYGDEARFDSAFAALIRMRADLEKYNLAKKSAEERALARKALEDKIREGDSTLEQFLSRFPFTDATSKRAAAEQVLKLRARYGILLDSDAQSSEKRLRMRQRIGELRDSYERFVSSYETVTGEPINEIRRKLTEYELIKSSLAKRRREAHSYALEHKIDENALPREPRAPQVSQSELASKISAIDEKLIAAERTKGRLENEYLAIMREIERIDELEQRVMEIKEKIDVYSDNLAVITKSKDLLATAKSNMTARYIGPTKEAFLRYVEMIDGASAEYTMDTTFTVSRLDMGKSRQAEAYSRGTQDLYILGLRLALIDSLYTDDKPPIILDDPFTSFDDKHVRRALALMTELAKKRQILYFTCSASRKP